MPLASKRQCQADRKLFGCRCKAENTKKKINVKNFHHFFRRHPEKKLNWLQRNYIYGNASLHFAFSCLETGPANPSFGKGLSAKTVGHRLFVSGLGFLPSDR